MKFNEKDEWTYGELKAVTDVPKKQIDAALLMLCKPAVKLLLKEKNKPVFDNEEEKISLNKAWKHQNMLVKLVP